MLIHAKDVLLQMRRELYDLYGFAVDLYKERRSIKISTLPWWVCRTERIGRGSCNTSRVVRRCSRSRSRSLSKCLRNYIVLRRPVCRELIRRTDDRMSDCPVKVIHEIQTWKIVYNNEVSFFGCVVNQAGPEARRRARVCGKHYSSTSAVWLVTIKPLE